jgi:hypothetical protein
VNGYGQFCIAISVSDSAANRTPTPAKMADIKGGLLSGSEDGVDGLAQSDDTPKIAVMGSIEEDKSITEVNAPDFDLPIIDFAKWKTSSTEEERYAIGKKLADACHNVGFVYIINHGVTPELLEEAFGFSKRLFDLTMEEKMLAPHPDGPNVHRGYSYPGLEKVSQVISSDEEVGKKLREVKDCKV